MFLRLSKFFLLLSLLFLPFSLVAQEYYYPLRIAGDVVLDGKLDDADWSRAAVMDSFMQTSPKPGADATERTEVRLLYNDDYLFVGIRCFDSEPSNLIRLEMTRDFDLGQDDAAGFLLDTYHDGTNAFEFVSNTLAARWDAQVGQDGGSISESFNTFWDVASTVDSLGYTEEFRIPFSSLRFQSADKVIMGFRASRLTRRKGELVTYPSGHDEFPDLWTNVSYARPILFENLKSKTPFYISPYAIANYSRTNVLNESGTAYELQDNLMVQKQFVKNETLDKILSNIGCDAKYGVTKNLTLDLTVNTDFAQAEVDDRIINLTRYDVNLPERRSFFLESAGFLSYGFPTGNEVFISRSIGREKDRIVPIIAGARLTGKSNGWGIGVLEMQTKGIEADSIAPHNFFVFRTRKDIDKLGSFIGGILTNRLNTDASQLSNQSIGIDFAKRFDPQLTLEGGLVSTLTNADVKAIDTSCYFQLGIFKSGNVGFTYNAQFDLVQKNFNPVMGYLDEPDHGLGSTHLSYQFEGKNKVQYWYMFTDEEYRWKLSTGRPETFNASLTPGVEFGSGAVIELDVFDYKVDTLGFDWQLDDRNAIASGRYHMWSNGIFINAPEKSKYSASLFASFGGFYGGTRIYLSPEASYYFNQHLQVDVAYEYNHINFDHFLTMAQHTLFQSNLLRVGLAYTFSTKVSLKLFTQYDDLSHSISSNLRFRYNPREGTDLYVVINQGLNSSRYRLEPHLPVLDNEEVTIKFVKTFEL